MVVIRAEGLWAELLCETPGEHWSIGLEAFGVRFDDEAEAATSDRGERVPVGFDLEWETPDRVVGELLVGRGRRTSSPPTARYRHRLTSWKGASVGGAAGAGWGHRAVDEVGGHRVVDAGADAAGERGVLGALEREQARSPGCGATSASAPT